MSDRLRCEELVATARTNGECPNRALYAAYVRGSGRFVPICGVHVRSWQNVAEDILLIDAVGPEGRAAMISSQRKRGLI